MFGFEDRLLHKLGNVKNLLTCNWMQERFWPVHVCTAFPQTFPRHIRSPSPYM